MQAAFVVKLRRGNGGAIRMSRKKLIPCEYKRSNLGAVFGIGVILFSAFLISQFKGYDPDGTAVKTVAVTGSVIAGSLFIVNMISLIKSRKKIEHMHYMLGQKSVKGRVVCTKRLAYFAGKEVPQDGPVKIRNVTYLYKMQIEWDDPLTGITETFWSEEYSEDLETILGSDEVLVYYSPDGDKWVEPLAYREKLSDPSLGGKKGFYDTVSYLIENHLLLFMAVTMGISILLFLVLIKIIFR